LADTTHRNPLDRFIHSRPTPRHEPEVEERLPRDAYEEVRAPRTRGREGLMLDVRLKGGRCSGFPYAYLVRVDYFPEDTIHLHFPQGQIVVEGRNLSDLYRRLLDHRVEAVQEGTEAEESLKPEEAAHISSITINENEEEETP
jgi:hypothetical protein